jgi:hypothetical protein
MQQHDAQGGVRNQHGPWTNVGPGLTRASGNMGVQDQHRWRWEMIATNAKDLIVPHSDKTEV